MIVDNRLAGKPRYWLFPPQDFGMRVPDDILKCVVFIGVDTPSGFVNRGTGFLVGVPASNGGSHNYVVTARHIIQKLAGRDLALRLNTKNGKVMRVTVPADQAEWRFHPTEEDATDVAVLYCQFDDEVDYSQISTEMFATPEVISKRQIGIGDDVFLAGLFTKMPDSKKLTPIVRTGTLSALPEDAIPNVKLAGKDVEMEAYLIEVHSYAALSGCPVFVRQTLERMVTINGGATTSQMLTNGPFYLLGLMHGHWKAFLGKEDQCPTESTDHQTAIGLGLSLAVPAQKILETLNRSDFQAEREAAEVRWQRRWGSSTEAFD